jgi:hypothetical protein
MKIENCEVVNDVDLLSDCKGFLSLDWEGNVERVLFKLPAKLSWYECIDKGGIPLYGYNGAGNVICSLALIKKNEQDHYGNVHKDSVVSVAKASRTDSWGWCGYKSNTEHNPTRWI